MVQILLVDDEKIIRDLVKEILECHGYDVQVACKGQEGLECFINSDKLF